jgi:LmbE family N-acetylglucosaminyl deacetylase
LQREPKEQVTKLAAPVVVLSPHFDDAVLSCGRLLARHPGATVVTALGGSPGIWDVFRDWDNSPEQCGFQLGTDVIAVRREEDNQSLARLDCDQRVIEALDSQYGREGDRPGIIKSALEEILAELRPRTFLLPLGLGHPDHNEVQGLALLAARADDSGCRWFAYEDLPYGPSDTDGSSHTAAFERFRLSGATLTRIELEVDDTMGRKLAAVNCYASQIRALDGPTSTRALFPDLENEAYWEVGFTT